MVDEMLTEVYESSAEEIRGKVGLEMKWTDSLSEMIRAMVISVDYAE